MLRISTGTVLAALLSLATCSGQSPSPPSAPVPVAAIVNGESIRLEVIDAAIAARLSGVAVPPEQLHTLRTDLVGSAVDELLLRQFFRTTGPAVPAAEVERHFKTLASSLARQGKTLTDWYRETRQSEAEAREIWTAMIQFDRYVAERISDDQLRRYHAANRDLFDRVEVRLAHILIQVDPSAPVADRNAAREKLEAIRAEIVAGRVEFAEAARKHSQAPTAATGGDLGFILRRGSLGDEGLCRAAFALRPGEISTVIEHNSSFQLILVRERKPGIASPFEVCRKAVFETLAAEYRVKLIADLRARSKISIRVP